MGTLSDLLQLLHLPFIGIPTMLGEPNTPGEHGEVYPPLDAVALASQHPDQSALNPQSLVFYSLGESLPNSLLPCTDMTALLTNYLFDSYLLPLF